MRTTVAERGLCSRGREHGRHRRPQSEAAAEIWRLRVFFCCSTRNTAAGPVSAAAAAPAGHSSPRSSRLLALLPRRLLRCWIGCRASVARTWASWWRRCRQRNGWRDALFREVHRLVKYLASFDENARGLAEDAAQLEARRLLQVRSACSAAFCVKYLRGPRDQGARRLICVCVSVSLHTTVGTRQAPGGQGPEAVRQQQANRRQRQFSGCSWKWQRQQRHHSTWLSRSQAAQLAPPQPLQVAQENGQVLSQQVRCEPKTEPTPLVLAAAGTDSKQTAASGANAVLAAPAPAAGSASFMPPLGASVPMELTATERQVGKAKAYRVIANGIHDCVRYFLKELEVARMHQQSCPLIRPGFSVLHPVATLQSLVSL